MIESLIDLDKQLFLIFNGIHATWLDPVMQLFSKTIASIPLYAFLLYQIYRSYKQRTWSTLLSLGFLILMTDHVTTGLMRPLFERLRPSPAPALHGRVDLVDGYP